MSDTVIRVENLGKKYIIGHQKQERYTALRDVVANGAKGLIHSLQNGKGKIQNNQEEFWALKDVSFEIKQGDRVGIIGRNGAGKSTLLKILSRITEPTKGSIKIKGRVASLLEVGTGFHPELTGRENIYLNGAILGMSNEEIKRKFDEIVAFAEVEKFLDTPVKRYSSGMYVRLAFSVAAHLEPEILVVDEVLAVGDAQFQEKCLGRMEDVAKEGRTVLFVSHNMGAIRALCDKGVFLSKGNLIAVDSVDKVIRHYNERRPSNSSSEYTAAKISDKPYFRHIKIFQDNNQKASLNIDKEIYIRFNIETYGKAGLAVGILIRNEQQVCVHHTSDEFSINKLDDASGRDCILPPYALASGKYFVDVFLGQRNIELFDSITDALFFEVDFSGVMSMQTSGSSWKGVCGPGLFLWQ